MGNNLRLAVGCAGGGEKEGGECRGSGEEERVKEQKRRSGLRKKPTAAEKGGAFKSSFARCQLAPHTT